MAEDFYVSFSKDGTSQLMLTPFFPRPVEGETNKVDIVQGYLFNYIKDQDVIKMPVEGCGERTAISELFVCLSTGEEGVIESAIIEDGANGDINVQIAEFEEGKLSKLFLRENIHYFTPPEYSGDSGDSGVPFSGEELDLYFIKAGVLKIATFYVKKGSVNDVEEGNEE